MSHGMLFPSNAEDSHSCPHCEQGVGPNPPLVNCDMMALSAYWKHD
jgi:hypothetical protein